MPGSAHPASETLLSPARPSLALVTPGLPPSSHRAPHSEPTLTLVTTLHHLNTNPRQVENLDFGDLVSIQMQIVKSSLENVFAQMFLLFVYSERCEFQQARVCLLSAASLPLNWDYQWLMGLDSNPIATPCHSLHSKYPLRM